MLKRLLNALTIGVLSGAMIALPIGCTQQQKITIAQEIVTWTPVFISTADTVNAAVESLAPETTIVLLPLTAAINAFGPQLQLAAQNYLKNPNQTTLQLLQALVTQIQQNVSSALLAAAKITNPASQAMATKQINLVATVINTILALVQSISSKAQVAAMAQQVHVTLAQVRPYMDPDALELASAHVARDTGVAQVPVDKWFQAEAQAGF